jgi:hypothetical protein
MAERANTTAAQDVCIYQACSCSSEGATNLGAASSAQSVCVTRLLSLEHGGSHWPSQGKRAWPPSTKSTWQTCEDRQDTS